MSKSTANRATPPTTPPIIAAFGVAFSFDDLVVTGVDVAEVKTEKGVTAMISSACCNPEADGISTLSPKVTGDNRYAPFGKRSGSKHKFELLVLMEGSPGSQQK